MSDYELAQSVVKAFDTACHKAYANGVKDTEDRIIKLLEEWGEKAGCFCCASDAAASEIIAFIKGEITSEEL